MSSPSHWPTAGLATAVLLVALATAPIAEAQAALYLHVIDTRAIEPIDDPEGPLVVDWYATDPARAAEQLGGEANDERARVVLPPSAAAADDPPADRHLEPSFMIDFDEPSVVALADELRTDLGVEPGERTDLEALTVAVGLAIGEKNMTRGWDLASRIAEHRVGDCTEHAVLLTAIARSFGVPARVVVGIALVFGDVGEIAGGAPGHGGDRASGFGHAWTELWDGETWRVYDATGIDAQAAGAEGVVRYLPTHRVEEEGPSYAFRLLGGMAAWPQRLEIAPLERPEPTVSAAGRSGP